MGKKSDMEALMFLIGLTIGILAVTGIWIISFLGDQQDAVNTRGLGEKLCETQNMSYDHREFIFNTTIPIIYCKEKIESRSLIDGVVVR